ncbi:MAG: penicillin-binding protein 1B [Gammaproteobacteria bacterium]|nr:MAG: penicillin-binding protein 1B [Gammaproteobacteria bacterium]RKZ44570.1 MAG: penicillin-binding protein 1B [Gammaproteobacteria bacterium]RKZ74156.1 MAG: penicillin-binding protein 1B [Gammaproteobacteria bacterium]
MTQIRKRRPLHSRRTHSSRRDNPKRYTPPRRTGFRFKWRWVAFIIILMFLGSYISSLDVKVRKQFEGKRWALPARVYARPLELYTGMRISSKTLTQELSAIGYRKSSTLYEPGQYQHKNNEVLITTRSFNFWDATDPSRQVRIGFAGNQVKSISQLNPGRKLALLRLEPRLIGKIFPTHHEDRIVVRLADMPPLLIEGLIAMEDRGFYNHWGISIRGTIRAFIANMKAGENVQGGSTITQQLVKNFYLTPERTFKRKFNEAIMAFLLEWHYTKEQIIEAYLNEVFLGQDGNRAIHGMGMAARFYFARPLKELKLPELALLVSVIRGASVYNPRKYPERTLERRNLVFKLMNEQGKITQATAEKAKKTPLGITKKGSKGSESEFPYPAFIGLVRRQLHQDYREEDLRSEGLQIFTTLNPYLQKTGEHAMINGLKKLQKQKRKARNLEGAMVVTNSESGEVLALINGKKPHYAGFNRPLNAVRQIGSLVKVAVYLAALEKNSRYSLTSLIDDSPYRWTDHVTGEVWKPQNYDYRSHGRVPLWRALANSYNLATVRLGMKLGLSHIKETLKRLGIEREFKMFPSVLLGSISLAPIEVAQMYQTIASGGFRVPVRAIRAVLDHEGKPLKHYGISVEQRFDAAPVFLLNYALQKVIRKGTGRKIGKTLPSSMVLAGKTGTSNDLRDSWFAGFGSELSTVTWVGRDDNKPMGLSGGSGAMFIWSRFIKAVRPESITPMTPSGVQWRSVKGSRVPYIAGQHQTSQALAGNNANLFSFE